MTSPSPQACSHGDGASHVKSSHAPRLRGCRVGTSRWLLPWTSIGHGTPTLSSAFRAEAPPPCDVGTGQDSRWRLHYDVYQYFLPEGDLSEASLLQHLQRMAGVPQVKASAAKVSVPVPARVARRVSWISGSSVCDLITLGRKRGR